MLRFGHKLRLNYRHEGRSGPSAPTLAPFLMADPELATYDVDLSWTPSNKMGSGDNYVIYWTFDGGEEMTLPDVAWPTTTALFSDSSYGPGTYCFWVVPVNTVGEGPSSNTVCVTLPGESSASYYRRPNGASLYRRPDGISLYLRP